MLLRCISTSLATPGRLVITPTATMLVTRRVNEEASEIHATTPRGQCRVLSLPPSRFGLLAKALWPTATMLVTRRVNEEASEIHATTPRGQCRVLSLPPSRFGLLAKARVPVTYHTLAMDVSERLKNCLSSFLIRKTQPDRIHAHCPQGRLVGLPSVEDSMNPRGSSADTSKI